MPQLVNISATYNIYEGDGIFRTIAVYKHTHRRTDSWKIWVNTQETYPSWLHIVLELSENVHGYCRVVKLSSAEVYISIRSINFFIKMCIITELTALDWHIIFISTGWRWSTIKTALEDDQIRWCGTVYAAEYCWVAIGTKPVVRTKS